MQTATFLSADHQTNIHYNIWTPETSPRAVLVLFHGMLEYGARYDEFARALNKQGIVVYAHDHLGHGHSMTDPSKRGHFADRRGNDYVIHDCLHMVDLAHADYPNLPLFLMGHSMGSFLTRQLLHQFYLPTLSGVILMGTGHLPEKVVRLGQWITTAIAEAKGNMHKSAFVNAVFMGMNNRRCFPRRSKNDWLTRDNDRADRFGTNPLIIDDFTVRAYADMLTGMLTNYDPAELAKLDTTVPMLLLSGASDPIGDYGKGVSRLFSQYQLLGYNDLGLCLYPGARHELLNETNRDEVTKDILDWMNARI